MSNASRWGIFVSLISTAVFAGLCGWAIGSTKVENPSGQSVRIEFPGVGIITIESRRDALDADSLLEQLFAEDFSRNGILGWLRDKQQLYSTESTDLATFLNTKMCDAIPDAPLEDRLAKAEECASKPLVDALRFLSQKREVPFHYVGERGRASVQSARPHRPGSGFVNVCRPGPFVAQSLHVMDPVTEQYIEVQAKGYYRCTHGTYPDIQLDPEDAKTLFRRPLDELEDVIVTVL